MQKSKVWVMLVRALCLACMPIAVWAASPLIQVVYDGNTDGFTSKVVQEWARLLKERSAGEVELQYDADGEYDTAKALEAMVDGKNVIALVALPVLDSTMSNIGMRSILPSKGTGLLFTAYSKALRKQGYRIVMSNYHGDSSLFLAKKPLTLASDLAGLRIAITTSPLQQQVLEAQKAIPVMMAADEVASALSYGTVDGAEGSLFTLYENGWQESAKYLSAIGGEPIVMVWLGSEEFLDALPLATQEMIADTAKAAGLYSQKLAATYTEDIKQALQDDGVQLIGFDTERAVPLDELDDEPERSMYRVPTATTMTP